MQPLPGDSKMKIIRNQVPIRLFVAAAAAILAAGPTAFAQSAAKNTFDGSYRGTFSGSYAGAPSTGSVAFSVANGAMTVTQPGQGTGSVSSSGAASFSGSLGVAKIDCKFVGAFQSPTGSQQGARASGSWSCAGMGQTGKGTWSANHE
jgi:uncharacterized membrane protein YgcG